MQPQLIAGRYRVERAIGRGGMGTVWLCRDEILGRDVAVKQIGGLPGESATETKRALREARSAAALNHPNAVAVYDVVDHEARPWLVMEYVEGETLADEISRHGRLTPKRVADIGAQLAGALARAHERRIVHRDIKPGNVLIDKSGRPKISDFGIARGHGDDQLTQIGFVTGTPGYLSPELARGGDPHPVSDVWALGATLYAAVEGQPPYEQQSNPIALLRAIATQRPRPMTHAGAIGPAIAAMMHEDPASRWDMATVARQLGGIAVSPHSASAVLPRVDSAATRVLASPPLVPTRRLPVATPQIDEPTQRSEAASPPPVVTKPRPKAVPPPLVPPGVVETATPVQASRRRRRPLALVALALVALGLAYVLSPIGDQSGTTAALSGTGVNSPVKTTAPAQRPTSEQPTTTDGEHGSGTNATEPQSDKKLEQFVEAYYAQVTKDTDRTWDQLSPTMQGAARGRDGYDGFWHTIDRVKVNQIQADADAKTAVVNLTFTRDDGTRSTETHQFTFVTDNGHYLIESDRNIR